MKITTFPFALWARSLTFLAAVALAALISSCAHFMPPEANPEPEPPVAETKPPPKPVKPPPPSRLYEWYGTDEYISRIEISVNEQKARFYSGDREVGWTTIASGVHKYPTPVGTFAVLEKVKNKKSNLYGKIYNKNGKLVRRNAKMGVHPIPAGGSFKGAPMPYFLRLTNDGIGLHAGPIPRPGKRASHGCIRMPKKFAPILYNHVDIGAAVTIKGKGPSYTSYLAKQRKSTPKPTPAVAQADAAPASAAGTTPTIRTGNDPDNAQAGATGSDQTASTSQASVAAAPLVTDAAANSPAPETPANPSATSAAGTAQVSNPTAALAPPAAAIPEAPTHPPANSDPAEVTSYRSDSNLAPEQAVVTAVTPSAESNTTAPNTSNAPLSSPGKSDPTVTPATPSPDPKATQIPATAPTVEATIAPTPSTERRPVRTEATPGSAASDATGKSEG
jgi:hypothetical protein